MTPTSIAAARVESGKRGQKAPSMSTNLSQSPYSFGNLRQTRRPTSPKSFCTSGGNAMPHRGCSRHWGIAPPVVPRAGEKAVRPSHVQPAISSSSGLVPRAQWMIEAGPELSDKDADANWITATRSRSSSTNRVPSSPSPSSFTGGNTLKITAEVMHPDTIVNLAIDTQSDVTTALREYLTDVHAIIPDRVVGLGGESDFHEEGTLHVWSCNKKQKISMPTLVAPRHQLPLDCIALLGVSAILKLEVAVEKHLRMPQFAMHIEAISINPRLLPEHISRVKKVIRDHGHVFEGHENTLPKPFNTEPITLKFKPNITPQSIPQPRWTVAQAKIETR
jgi:hypothetical protein